MAAPEKHQNLVWLARLRADGFLTGAEFVRAKGLLFCHSDTPTDSGRVPAPPRLERLKQRWPAWIAAGLVLCGSTGWTMTDWDHVNTGPAQSEAPLQHDPSIKAHTPHSESDDNADSARQLSQDRQIELAFEAVFGNGERVVSNGEENLRYAKGTVVWTGFGPVLIAEATGEEHPGSLGALGMFYLREVSGPAFKEVRRWPDAVTGSIMGNPPRWKVRHDILDGLVIESTSGGVWQGYACDSTTLTQLTGTGPVSLVTFNSRYDSTGAAGDDGERYDGAITHIARDHAFDVVYTGTRPITEHYVKKGKNFVRIPDAHEEMNESAVPGC